MQELFTYKSLGTLTGAVTATVLLVQFLKMLRPFRWLPARLLVIMVAEGVVIITNIATNMFSVANVPLYFLNGLPCGVFRYWKPTRHQRPLI